MINTITAAPPAQMSDDLVKAMAPVSISDLIEMIGGQVVRLEELYTLTGKALSPVLNIQVSAVEPLAVIDARSEVGKQLAELLYRLTMTADRLMETLNSLDLR